MGFVCLTGVARAAGITGFVSLRGIQFLHFSLIFVGLMCLIQRLGIAADAIVCV